MKALTLTQPWAGLVASGIKRIENRRRPIINARDWGTRFAIHASREIDEDVYDRIYQIAPELYGTFGLAPWSKLSRKTSAVIAVATVVTFVTDKRQVLEYAAPDQERWFFGPLGYVLRDVIALETPVPCRGRQGFWMLHGDVERQVRKQLARMRIHVGAVLRSETADGAWERVTVTATEALQCLKRTEDGMICTPAERCMPFQNFGGHPEGFEIRADDGACGFLDYDGEGKTWEWPT
jgi:hypothetical protein